MLVCMDSARRRSKDILRLLVPDPWPQDRLTLADAEYSFPAPGMVSLLPGSTGELFRTWARSSTGISGLLASCRELPLRDLGNLTSFCLPVRICVKNASSVKSWASAVPLAASRISSGLAPGTRDDPLLLTEPLIQKMIDEKCRVLRSSC